MHKKPLGLSKMKKMKKKYHINPHAEMFVGSLMTHSERVARKMWGARIIWYLPYARYTHTHSDTSASQQCMFRVSVHCKSMNVNQFYVLKVRRSSMYSIMEIVRPKWTIIMSFCVLMLVYFWSTTNAQHRETLLHIRGPATAQDVFVRGVGEHTTRIRVVSKRPDLTTLEGGDCVCVCLCLSPKTNNMLKCFVLCNMHPRV